MLAALPAGLVMEPATFASFEAGIGVTLLPYFTPDLDIGWRKFNVLGEFIGLAAYARMVPHRYGARRKHWSRFRIWDIIFMSHVPLLGTLLRTLLILQFVVPVGLLLDMSWLQIGLQALWFWLGMSLSDLGHLIADRPWKRRVAASRSKYWRSASAVRGRSASASKARNRRQVREDG